jgi:2-polyprenyl-3-methyl-5-hydroxy-6-metoxy-1,4-benzoquinol methylase
MSVPLQLCRFYQSLFRNGHPDEGRLVELHRGGHTSAFLREYFQHEYQKGLELVARFERWSQNWGGMKALDFGCGGGGLTYRMAARFRDVWGLDLEADKLAFAEQQADALGIGNAHFACYDGTRLPFDDAAFDCLFCIDVMEHLPGPAHFVAEFARVLRPGGLLFISFGPPWRHAHGKHMWAMLPGWWTHLLFPRATVMELSGFPRQTTWEELGMHRLTVGTFEKVMRSSPFEALHQEHRLKKALRPLARVPVLREFFIAEVVAVYRKPAAVPS